MRAVSDESPGWKRWYAFMQTYRWLHEFRRNLRALRRAMRVAPPMPDWYTDERVRGRTIRGQMQWLEHGRDWCLPHRLIVEDQGCPHVDIGRLSQDVDRAAGDPPVAPTQDDIFGAIFPTQMNGCAACRLAPTLDECDAALRSLIKKLDRRLN